MSPTTLATAAFAAGTAGLVLRLRSRKRNQSIMRDRQRVDASAAFPTAQLVAAMRAVDLESDAPLIGTNIGGGPDRAAPTFSGDLGRRFLRDYAGAFGMPNEAGDRACAVGLVKRSMYFDAAIMEAVDERSVQQIVILAAGLDARAWRLPRLGPAVTLYEVDVERAFAFKRGRIAALPPDAYPDGPTCARVEVVADLSDPAWKDTLVGAGFDPSAPSVFVVEGLLMYLPPGAPRALLGAVASLMAPGSTLSGDCMVNFIDSPFMTHVVPVLAKYGTKWTFDVPTAEAFAELLAGVALPGARIKSLMNAQPEEGAEKQTDTARDTAKPYNTVTDDADAGGKPLFIPADGYKGTKAGYVFKTCSKGVGYYLDKRQMELESNEQLQIDVAEAKINAVIGQLHMWPAAGLDWLHAQLRQGDTGVANVATGLVEDRQNYHGLAHKSDAFKARVVAQLLAGDFGATLKANAAAAKESSRAAGGRPDLRSWLTSVRDRVILLFPVAVQQVLWGLVYGAHNKSDYIVYTVTKE